MINPDTNIYQDLVFVLLQSLLILILLIKATSYAKKASGAFGEVVIGAGKAVVGLALGGAALGTAAALRGTVGAVAKSIQSPGAMAKNANIGANLS